MQRSVLSFVERRDGHDRWLRLAVSVAGVVVVAAACSGGGTGGPAPGGAVTTTTSSSVSSPPAGQQVTVMMTDFRLALPNQTLTPGTYTFVAVNAGHTVHAIQIDGPGVSDERTPGVVQPGQSATLTVTLQPGSYDMYCPVDGHRAMGMDTHFTVR